MKEFKGYKKGVNLGGWFSQCEHTTEHYEDFIAKSDIEKIASWGADHVRLPIDYELLETENAEPVNEGFAYIDRAAEWCRAAGLNMILDLHKTAGYSFDEGEGEKGFFESPLLQERYFRLWERIAEHCAGYSDMMCFELLNEVTEQSVSGIWNGIVRECIGRIRKYAPDTVILVGSYWQNSPDAVKDLDPPYDDKVVYNCHCYDPLKFTHQGAPWVKDMPVDFRMSFKESGVDREYFLGRFKEAAETAAKNGTVLYCGEYGVIDRAAPEDTVEWYRAIHEAFEELDMGRAAWSYKAMDFGLSDERLKGVIGELIKNL